MEEVKKLYPFPKIFHVGEAFVDNLFKGPVEVTEKIDGSQWAFGINEDGELLYRSKGQDLTNKPVPKLFEKAMEQTDRIAEILYRHSLQGIFFYCEFLSKVDHNILNYGRVPRNNLYLFGVLKNRKFVSDIEELWYFADLLEIERANLLYYGELKNVEDVENLLEETSVLGKEKVEGIVIKNYNEPSGLGSFVLPISMGKYVSEKFKERFGAEWGKKHTSKGKLETFLQSFRTEARWLKTIQHLREQDKLENSPRDIGILLEELTRDLIEEEEENIKSGLYKIFKEDVIRTARRGFPEFYKKYLLKKSFQQNNK
jgi:hypothetical protein